MGAFTQTWVLCCFIRYILGICHIHAHSCSFQRLWPLWTIEGLTWINASDGGQIKSPVTWLSPLYVWREPASYNLFTTNQLFCAFSSFKLSILFKSFIKHKTQCLTCITNKMLLLLSPCLLKQITCLRSCLLKLSAATTNCNMPYYQVFFRNCPGSKMVFSRKGVRLLLVSEIGVWWWKNRYLSSTKTRIVAFLYMHPLSVVV